MIDIACLPPAVNQADIYRNGLSNMGLSPASDALNEFGISLGNQMAVVPGRILDSPKIAYLGKVLETRDSAWNLRDQKFVKAVPLKNCLALAINERQGDFQGAGDPDFENVRNRILTSHPKPWYLTFVCVNPYADHQGLRTNVCDLRNGYFGEQVEIRRGEAPASKGRPGTPAGYAVSRQRFEEAARETGLRSCRTI